MRYRSSLGALFLTGVLLPVTSCSSNPELTSITVNPATVTTSMSAGLYVNFTAIGYYTHPGHTAVTQDITDQAVWSSSFPQFVTINATNGVATVTGYGYGIGAIYASAPGFHGDVVGSSAFTISPPTAPSGGAQTLALVPSKSADGAVRFTAIGRTEDGKTVQLAGQPEWVSTDNMVATIDKATGLLTTIGSGRTTITAVYTNPDGTTAIGKTYFNVQP
jgi:Big-like domain-containing protein